MGKESRLFPLLPEGGEMAFVKEAFKTCEEIIVKQCEDIKNLLGALEFYADVENYYGVAADNGIVAKRAINKVRREANA